MHTAQHLAKFALSGELARNRTIILVTHHISLCLPIASYLVELSNGTIIRQGSVQELESQGQLRKLVEVEDVAEEVPEVEDDKPMGNEADIGTQDVVPRKSQKLNGKLIDAEARAEGRVALSTYMTYIRAAGTWSWLVLFLLMVFYRTVDISSQVRKPSHSPLIKRTESLVMSQVFLAKWGEAYEQEDQIISIRKVAVQWFWERLPSPNADVKPWLLVYLDISVVGAFTVLGIISFGYYASLKASRSLFKALLTSLTGAQSRFYDITPIGRILNRFTTDINCIDDALLNSVRSAMAGVFNFVASIVVIVYVVPPFAPVAIFIAWLYIRIAPSYVKASRDLRRLESISLSPAFAGFDELLRGLPHVRAFAMETRYQNRFYQRVDKFQSFDHVYVCFRFPSRFGDLMLMDFVQWLVANWLMWRYDCLFPPLPVTLGTHSASQVWDRSLSF